MLGQRRRRLANGKPVSTQLRECLVFSGGADGVGVAISNHLYSNIDPVLSQRLVFDIRLSHL